MIYRPLPYLIGDVVTEVRNNFSEGKVLPYYEFGLANEVVNTLNLKTDGIDWDKKYPMIWLLIKDNVEEDVDNSKALPRNASGFSIIICTETQPEYVARDRYENTIIPILRPLYESFMYYLKRSKILLSEDRYSHKYYENLFWGKEGLYGHTGNIFNDRLDAIIIDDLKLRIKETC